MCVWVVKQKQREGGGEKSKEQSFVVAELSQAAIVGQNEKSALCVGMCWNKCEYLKKWSLSEFDGVCLWRRHSVWRPV